VFVDASKRDPSDPKVDMIYTWKCSRDEEICLDIRELRYWDELPRPIEL